MNKTKFEKGITLIALIITIIVLLIIAVVAIGAVQESSIITHAQNAASDYRGKQGEEKDNIIKAEELMDEYAGSEEKLTPTDSKFLNIAPTGQIIGFNEEYKISDGVYGEGDNIITNLIIPDKVIVDGNEVNVTGFRPQAFYNCTAIKTVVLPKTIIAIPPNVFSNCTSLTKVTLQEGITGIYNMAFKDCNKLTEINIPSTVTSMGKGAFDGCSSDLIIKVAKYESECSSWTNWSGNAKVIYEAAQ